MMWSAISRRAFIGGAGAMGVGVATQLPGTAFAQTSGVQDTGAGSMVEPFADAEINFQVLFALGAAGQGTAEYGEVATVIDRIAAAGSTFDAVHDEFVAMSQEVAAKALAAGEPRHEVTARARYLRAARYLTPPLYFVLGTSDPSHERAASAYREMRRLWNEAGKLFDPPIEAVKIPYETGSSLPGWFLRPPGAGDQARPTVILNNGNDAQMIDIYAYGGAAAIERGYNALIVEGPGQGGMLFLRNTKLRPDWNKVITPVVDYLRGRDDVDPKRIALSGWSEGGELVAQALTKEHRLAAGVVDPGNFDELAAFDRIPQEFIQLVDEGKQDEANAEWDAIFPTLPAETQFTYTKSSLPFGQRTFYDNIKRIQQFKLSREQIGKIRNPMLVTAYEGEQFYPGQAEEVFDALRTKKKLARFTAAEGAQLHDAPMAPQVRNEVVFDWLDEYLS